MLDALEAIREAWKAHPALEFVVCMAWAASVAVILDKWHSGQW